MSKARYILVRLTLLMMLLAAGFSAEPRHITVYAPQTTYQVDILVREGVDYAGLTDLLEPLGRLESHVDGNRLTLVFNGAAAEFQDGRKQYRTSASTRLELGSNFLIVDGRGYVPIASIPQLLPRIANLPAELHTASRRLFVGGTPMHFTAELRHAPAQLVLTFPAPVNPASLIEKNRVRLLFRREPVVSSGPETVTYLDAFVQSTNFVETPDGAEIIVNVQQPATVTVSDNGRTVIVNAAAPQAMPSAPAATAPSAATQAGQAHPSTAPARGRPFVILDAAHGGADNGVELASGVEEKAVTLAFARRLQKELENRGVTVVLTRTADVALAFDQRASAANSSRAALLVSIHASAIGHGVRIYTALLPAQPSSQQTDPGKRALQPWELAQQPYLALSGHAATALAGSLDSQGIAHRSSAAPLRPLNNVTLAAIAIELAPLHADPKELGSAEYQQKMAAALAAGIAELQGKLEAAP
jgi:N-acetylmuramoyl-L-alanine amidase